MTSPEVPHRSTELGASLKRARGNLTQSELAERAGWGKSGKTKVSKIESGRQLPDEDDLNAWADITEAGDRLREQWKTLAAQVDEVRSNYRKRARHGQQPVQKAYSDLAAETTHFRFFEMTFIPRYLQVPEYTRATLQEHHDKHGSIDDVEAAAQERLSSARYLYDLSKKFVFLIDEPVLRKTRFPASIMRPQLDRLLSVIGLSNVTLAVYPSLSRPVHSLTESSFELFDDVGYIETALEDAPRLLANDVESLEKLFERYWQDAAVGDEARQLILDAISHLQAG
jgi:transcriptional regulator with XRE-family HTH domain